MSFSERTYGELLDINPIHEKITNILSLKNLKISNFIFYDFGSGTGKVVHYFSKLLKYAIGIEIDKNRYEQSLKFESESPNCYFKNINFFEEKIQSPCILFLNNLCFGKGTNKRLSLKFLKECHENDIIISTTKLYLLQEYFCYEITSKCSWGESEFYFYVLRQI